MQRIFENERRGVRPKAPVPPGLLWAGPPRRCGPRPMHHIALRPGFGRGFLLGWRCRNQERRPVAMGQAASLTAPGDGHSSAAKSKIISSYSRGHALNRIPLQRVSTVLRGRRPPIRNLGRRLAKKSGKIRTHHTWLDWGDRQCGAPPTGLGFPRAGPVLCIPPIRNLRRRPVR